MVLTSFTSKLKSILPESCWPWVFNALRQDSVIWETLQGEFGQRVLDRKTARPEDYFPASLALFALDSKLYPEDLRRIPMVTVDTSLRQRAEWATKTLQAAEGNLGPSNPLSLTFVQAGLLALDLRERRLGINSWDSLSSDLAKLPPTALACLFGMVNQPVEMVLALAQSGSLAGRIKGIDLALHVLLSQPVPEEKHGEIVKTLLSRVPPPVRLILLQQLEDHRPALAAEGAAWMLVKQLPGAEDGQECFFPPLQNLAGALTSTSAYRIAGQTDMETESLAVAIQASRYLQAQLAARLAEASQKLDHRQEALAAWKQAADLDPVSPEHLTGLAQCLLAGGRAADAQARLGAHPASQTSPGLLYAGARLAAARGDAEKARQLAGQAVAMLRKGLSTPNNQPIESSLQVKTRSFYRDLARLLIELDLPAEAVQAAQISLKQEPNQPEMLVLASKAYARLGSSSEAAQAAHLAVALEPGQIAYRRHLAECLETLEDWGPALAEWKTLLSRLGDEHDETEEATHDLYSLAKCTIHAGFPEQAVQTCKKLLQKNPNDGLAFTLLGEASSAQDDDEMALDHLHQATQMAPDQAAPWLALARVYQKIGQAPKALETLQSATRAAPGDAAVHLALGEAHLDRNAPTQALPVLRKAADLAYASPSCSSRFTNWIAYRLGQTLHQLGHLAEARQVLEQANHSNPSNPDIAQGYAQVLLSLGDQRSALSPLEVVLQSNPAVPEPYLNYARSLMALAGLSGEDEKGTKPLRIEQAVPPLRKALEITPDLAEARALLAEALSACGELLPALEAYRQALDSDLAQEPAWQTRLSLGLGRIALKIGQIETAIAALQEANQADPLNPEIQRALSEAYDAAGLTENAFQAARAAILLAPEDIDLLLWFADQALELRTRPGAAASQTQNEAIHALNRAAAIAPNRTELLIRLGQIQIQAGDPQAARGTFNNLAANESKNTPSDRNIPDLYLASKNLLRLEDPLGAAACLELALQSNRRRTDWSNSPTSADTPGLLILLTDLAAARHQAGRHQAAIEALEQAITVAPDQASLYLDKADLHLEMNSVQSGCVEARQEGTEAFQHEAGEDKGFETVDHIQSAQFCLETALKLNPEDGALYQRAALIQRMTGDLPAALAYAERAIEISEKRPSTSSQISSYEQLDLAARVLAADLARAQFDNRRARQYVDQQFPLPQSDDPLSSVDYFCLRAELSLESSEILLATEDLSTALDLAPEHPRVLAIQARLVAQRGDNELAARTLHDAVEALVKPDFTVQLKTTRDEDSPMQRGSSRAEHTAPEVRGIGLLSKRVRMLGCQISAAEAAVELRQWETGLHLLREVTNAAPLEPYYQLRMARALVLRAEYQNLCQVMEVVQHAPGLSALSSEAQQLFETAIQAAEHQAGSWQSSNAQGPSTVQPILRWRARGRAIFLPSLQSAEEIGSLPQDAEDAAARVACLSQVGSLPEASKAARSHPHHPRVLIHLSLALAREKPRQALAAAHAAVEAVIRPESFFRTVGQPGAELSGRVDLHKSAHTGRKEDAPLVHALLARLVHQYGNRSGDSAVAMQAIQTALSLWPDEPRWQALAAEIYKGRGSSVELADPTRVIQHLEQAVKLEPKHASHYLALGKVYLLEGSSQRAIQVLEQATRLAPNQPEPWLVLAQAFQASGDLDQAASRAERAVTLAPQDSTPLLLRGEIALKANNPRGALSRAQAALRIDAEDPSAHLLLARSLSALERPDEALAAIEKALPLAPNPLPFQVERARLMLQSKEQETALQALQELAELYPSEPTVLSLLAECLAEVGQREAAIHTAQRALRVEHDHSAAPISSEHANMHYLLGRLLRRTGQLDQAIHHLSEAVQHAPNMVEPFLELGHTHQERRQFTQALNAYQQAALVAPSDPRGFYHAGLAFKESKDYLSAESMLRKAANLAPDDLSVHRLLAAVVALNLVHNRREMHAGV